MTETGGNTLTPDEEREQWHGRGYIVIRSELLGEDVVITKVPWDIRPNWTNQLAVYTLAEIKLLAGHTDDEVMRLHRIKKTFRGEIVARNS